MDSLTPEQREELRRLRNAVFIQQSNANVVLPTADVKWLFALLDALAGPRSEGLREAVQQNVTLALIARPNASGMSWNEAQAVGAEVAHRVLIALRATEEPSDTDAATFDSGTMSQLDISPRPPRLR